MLRIVIKKLLSNRWMFACLLLSSILAAAMVSSIPIYVDGVLQRMMLRDLENYQEESGLYPSGLSISAPIYSKFESNPDMRLWAYNEVDNAVNQSILPSVRLPVLAQRHMVSVGALSARHESREDTGSKLDRMMVQIDALSGMEDNVELLYGRLPSPEPVDGVFEAVVTERGNQVMSILMNTIYYVKDEAKRYGEEWIKFTVVGMVGMKEGSDAYWPEGLKGFEKSLIIDYDMMLREFIDREPSMITTSSYYTAYDYHALTLSGMPAFKAAIENAVAWGNGSDIGVKVQTNCLEILNRYGQRENQLRTTLWVLQVPVLMMLAFFMFMLSQLIVDFEKNETSVMKSRGAGQLQILRIYLLQSTIVSAVSLVIGPLLGYQMCNILGASNGFLEFVQRSRLSITLELSAYIYALCAAVISIVTMLLPAIFSSRASIVEQKKRKRVRGGSLWKKMGLDFVLLAISLYGLYTYQQRQLALSASDTLVTDVPIDPILFLISTLFILGAGLLVLRIYPLFVRFIFFIGRKLWSPVLYATFIQVGRSGGQEQFMMLFLILTLSVGLFSANSARTINKNVEERIRYKNGADLVLVSQWGTNKPLYKVNTGSGEGSAAKDGQGNAVAQSLIGEDALVYIEPPFSDYSDLKGTTLATKVFIRNDLITSQKATYMAIIPSEFGQVASLRGDLLDTHWYKYLNVLTENENFVIISEAYAEEYGAKPGDALEIRWEGQQGMEVIVYDVVGYWPTLNPNMKDSDKFIVGNLNYMHKKMALEPYEVWYARDGTASTAEIYEDIGEKGLAVREVRDTRGEIVAAKRDPLLQGTNGALTLGFIVAMAISSVGFIVYWVLSIKSRQLQFGIFRAMGMSTRHVIGMLFCEQVLISFVAILMGIIVGGVASELFVPLLQVVYSSVDQVPPFRVVYDRSDYLKIYAFVAAMIAGGFILLGSMISRLKVSQAIKLGED